MTSTETVLTAALARLRGNVVSALRITEDGIPSEADLCTVRMELREAIAGLDKLKTFVETEGH
jgi:hypothetical protein